MNETAYKKKQEQFEQGLNMADKGETTQLASIFNVVRFYPKHWEAGAFLNDQQQKVFYAKAPAEGENKVHFVYTTGYAGNVNYDYATIRKLQERHGDVYAMDWINQGLSDRENPTDITDANSRLLMRNVLDLKKFVETVVPHDGKPIILVTHSMGGNINMQLLKFMPETFDGAIMAAPMLDLNTSVLPRPVFKGIVNAMNSLGLGDKSLPDWRNLINRVKATSANIEDLTTKAPEKLSLTESAQLRMRELLRPTDIDLPTWAGIKGFYPTMDQMRQPDYYNDIKTPVLLISGGNDELVSNKAIAKAAKNLPNGHLLELPNTGHDVWNTRTHADETALDNRIDTFLSKEIRHPYDIKPPAVAPKPANPDLRSSDHTKVAANEGWFLQYG